MEKFLEEIKNINWIKNSVLFIAYFLILLVFFLIFIRPELKNYKQHNIDYRKAEFLYKETSNLYTERKNRLQELQKANRKILSSFRAVFDKDSFIQHSRDYFREFDITDIQPIESEHPILKQQRIKIKALLQSPEKFFEYYHFLNNSGYIIQADFPINFHTDRKVITAEFALNIFTLKESELPPQP